MIDGNFYEPTDLSQLTITNTNVSRMELLLKFQKLPDDF